jgi:hypothetical protein
VLNKSAQCKVLRKILIIYVILMFLFLSYRFIHLLFIYIFKFRSADYISFTFLLISYVILFGANVAILIGLRRSIHIKKIFKFLKYATIIMLVAVLVPICHLVFGCSVGDQYFNMINENCLDVFWMTSFPIFFFVFKSKLDQ